ncbi:amidophosphoribosyltransferase [Marivirga lumbricoides]|uniref:Amidophosphoribosyltransferase n=1 Tax=Marivirga lumbricoides TaxID=1046115 RepID=A0ABQ1MJ07_9BACT|nr:amidophosphoribosyltransferase [Marivirga lumbricoides]
MHKNQPNVLHPQFFEIPGLTYAMAFCWFKKGSVIQKLLHQLKYDGNEELGVFLGELYGKQLREYQYHEKIDIITTVPLHYLKYRKRGYNQSDKIAEGLASSLELPFLKLIKKEVNRKSQTRKDRLQRFENVASTFSALRTKESICGKHILVVDDVLTTGATIQSACQPLLEKGAKISILTIAAVK